MAKAVGIDLGTTNSVVAAVMKVARQRSYRTPRGSARPRGAPHGGHGRSGLLRGPGQSARRSSTPRTRSYSVKRFIGAQVGRGRRRRPRSSPTRPSPNHAVRIEIRGKQYAPEGDSALILRKLAETRQRRSARRSPRRSSPCRRTSTTPSARRPRTPARSPGSRCCASSTSPPRRRSPTASTRTSSERVAGLRPRRRHLRRLDPRARRRRLRGARHHGDDHLGGDDFDQRIVDWLADGSWSDRASTCQRQEALQRLREAAERAKHELSSTTRRSRPAVHHGDAGGPEAPEQLADARQARAARPLTRRADVGPCEQALADARLTADDIDEVILVGGSTRMPARAGVVRRLSAARSPHARQPGRGRRHRRGVSRPACSRASSRTCSSSTSRLSPSASRRSAASRRADRTQHHDPGRRTEIFSTAEDNQPSVEGRTCCRASARCARQPALGPLRARRHPAGAARLPQIEVTFDIEATEPTHATSPRATRRRGAVSRP